MKRSRVVLITMALLVASVPFGNASDGDGDTSSITVPAWERYATLHFILEKTFLKVDAVKVDMRVGGETAQAVLQLLEGREKVTNDLADSVAVVLLDTRHADIDLEFLVSFSLKKFLKGSKKNIEGGRMAIRCSTGYAAIPCT